MGLHWSHSGETEKAFKILSDRYDISIDDLHQIKKRLQKRYPSGYVSSESLTMLFPKNCSSQLYGRIWKFFDLNGNGEIGLDEYIVGMVRMCYSGKKERLGYIFDIFDLDGNHLLTKGEVMDLVSVLFDSVSSKPLTPEEKVKISKQLFQHMDEDNDGQIDKEEFLSITEKNESITKIISSFIGSPLF
jgi:Ca2+-binding EF-hand superfamily protein